MADLKLVFASVILSLMALHVATMSSGGTGSGANFFQLTAGEALQSGVSTLIIAVGAALSLLLIICFAGSLKAVVSKAALVLLALLGLAGVTAFVLISARQEVTCGSCNLIIISYDSFKASDSEIYGDAGKPTTPNLAGLAGESIVFDRAYSVSTDNLLMTADYSLLSSSYASTHLYVVSDHITRLYPEKASALARPPTLFSILKENGYSSYFVGPDSRRTGHFLYTAVGNGSVDGATFVKGDAASIFPAAAEAVGKAPAGKPFFLFVDAGPPPSTLQPDEWSPYGKERFSPRVLEALKDPKFIWANASSKKALWRTPQGDETLDITVDEVRALAADKYGRYLRESDAAFGDLIGSLKRRDLLGKTVIVVTSAAGLVWDEPQSYTFFSLQNRLEPSEASPLFHWLFPSQFSNARVPLVMHVPGVSRRKVDYPVQTIDVAPTLLRFLGLQRQGTFEGNDLYGSILARTRPARPVAFFEDPEYPGAVATGANGTFTLFFSASMVSEEDQLTLPPGREMEFFRQDYARGSNVLVIPPVLSGLSALHSRFPYTLDKGKVGEFEMVSVERVLES